MKRILAGIAALLAMVAALFLVSSPASSSGLLRPQPAPGDPIKEKSGIHLGNRSNADWSATLLARIDGERGGTWPKAVVFLSSQVYSLNRPQDGACRIDTSGSSVSTGSPVIKDYLQRASASGVRIIIRIDPSPGNFDANYNLQPNPLASPGYCDPVHYRPAQDIADEIVALHHYNQANDIMEWGFEPANEPNLDWYRPGKPVSAEAVEAWQAMDSYFSAVYNAVPSPHGGIRVLTPPMAQGLYAESHWTDANAINDPIPERRCGLMSLSDGSTGYGQMQSYLTDFNDGIDWHNYWRLGFELSGDCYYNAQHVSYFFPDWMKNLLENGTKPGTITEADLFSYGPADPPGPWQDVNQPLHNKDDGSGWPAADSLRKFITNEFRSDTVVAWLLNDNLNQADKDHNWHEAYDDQQDDAERSWFAQWWSSFERWAPSLHLPVALRNSNSASTAVFVQNLGPVPAGGAVLFRDEGGTLTGQHGLAGLDVGAGAALDQRDGSGDPGTDPFQGSGLAAADWPLAGVVNIMRSGATPSYDSYNAVDDTAAGRSLRVLDVRRAVSRDGKTYNTTLYVQNTSAVVTSSVTLTFIPDPILNPQVGGTLGGPASRTYDLTAGGALVLDQATQSDPDLGEHFWGQATIESSVSDVAVLATINGSGQTLQTEPAFTVGSNHPLGLPLVYRNALVGGELYSTTLHIANLSPTVNARVEIQYERPDGWSSQTQMVTVAAGSAVDLDLQASAVISDGFTGAAMVTAEYGVPVAVLANARGGGRQATTYAGLSGGAATGGQLSLPVAYKNIAADSATWSSTLGFYAFETAQVNLTFHDLRGGGTTWTAGPYSVVRGSQFDLASHASTEGHADFLGSIVVDVVSGNVGAVVQTLGSGGTGDTLLSYQAASPSLTPFANPAVGFGVYTQPDVNCAAPQYDPVARWWSGQDVGDWTGWGHDWYVCTDNITATLQLYAYGCSNGVIVEAKLEANPALPPLPYSPAATHQYGSYDQLCTATRDGRLTLTMPADRKYHLHVGAYVNYPAFCRKYCNVSNARYDWSLGNTPAAPANPSNLVATVQAGPQVSLSWTDNATNETGFAVERSDNGGVFASIVLVDPHPGTGNVTFLDTAVATGNTYAYRVEAVNEGQSSGYAGPASVSVP